MATKYGKTWWGEQWLGAHVIQHVCRSAVYYSELSADVAGDLRSIPCRSVHHSEIGNYEGVDSGTLSLLEKARQVLELVLTREGVAGQMHRRTLCVGKRAGLLKLLI